MREKSENSIYYREREREQISRRGQLVSPLYQWVASCSLFFFLCVCIVQCISSCLFALSIIPSTAAARGRHCSSARRDSHSTTVYTFHSTCFSVLPAPFVRHYLLTVAVLQSLPHFHAPFHYFIKKKKSLFL